MAIAWYYSFALIKQYERTIGLFEARTLTPWVQNKSIQKAIESYRIAPETKAYLRTLKIRSKGKGESEMEKTQYRKAAGWTPTESIANEIGKPSGLWQLMQGGGIESDGAETVLYGSADAGQALMLARVDLAIPEQIGLKEALLSSSLALPSTRATFLRNYSLMRGSETVAFAATQWTLVDLASRKILKIDAVDFGNYWMGDYQELIHGIRIDKETLTAMQTVGQKEVRYSDLDYNGHMNNTYYLDVLSDSRAGAGGGHASRLSFVRVHYSKEAPLGDVTILRSDIAILRARRMRAVRRSGRP